MIVINPRAVALDTLMQIIEQKTYSNLALKHFLKQNGAMPQRNKAFVTELVNGTLRNLNYIDFFINAVSKVKTEKCKPVILSILRLGAYQILFMDKVPVSAACNESVRLAKERSFQNLAGFVNGVLRNIERQKDTISLPDEKENPVEYLSIQYSHPKWLLKMWLHEYSFPFVKELCIENNKAPDFSIVTNDLKINPDLLAEKLKEKKIQISKGRYHKNVFYLSKTSDISKLEEFQQGFFHVQDESSVLAVDILQPKSGEKVLDICAAPGGKSILAAQRMENCGTIVSCDIYEHKLELIENAAKRLGITMIHTQLKNGEELDSENLKAFDKVLVDAPCSGLGLIRKKPDIRFSKNGNDIDTLVPIQRKILENASYYVKPNGILVYSTCTICKKENFKNIEWFMNQFPFDLCDLSPFLPENLVCDTREKGMIQLLPHIHHTDGFFIARLKRRG